MAMSDIIGTTNENGTVDFKKWMIAVLSMKKQIHYYFKRWMAAIRVIKQIDFL